MIQPWKTDGQRAHSGIQQICEHVCMLVDLESEGMCVFTSELQSWSAREEKRDLAVYALCESRVEVEALIRAGC